MKTFSIRTLLAALVVAALLPLLGFSGYAVLRFYESERERATERLEQQTRNIALNIDSSFETIAGLLKMVSVRSSLESGDVESVRAALARIGRETGFALELRRRDGTRMVAFEPDVPAYRVDPKVFDGATAVTDVMAGPAGEPVVAVAVPALVSGEIYALSALLGPRFFARLLAGTDVPRDWIVSIVDRRGVHAIRSHRNEEFAGKPVVPRLVERIRIGDIGTAESTSLEGIPLLVTLMPTESGWHAAVGLPRARIYEVPWLLAREMLVAGLAVALASGLLALFVARHFDTDVQRLRRSAARLAYDGGDVTPPPRLRELAEVEGALREASHEIAAARADLEARVEERTAALRQEMAKREASEQQARQLQRLEAVGQLTGGVAHDFNNMLAIVLGSLDLAEKHLERGPLRTATYLAHAREGAQRAATLTRRLLAFSRQQALQPVVLDINRVVTNISELLRRTVPETIRIETVLGGGLWRANVDPGELDSALVNLAVNAQHAMPNGGRLTIETANAHLDDAYAEANPGATAGQYVLIAVSDTGHGMTAEEQARAFEPYFTTKAPGHGTGLGLAQVYGFVKQCGGQVKIYSEPGKGVSVKLYFPRSLSATTSPPETVVAAPTAATTGRILVVEDDPDVRAVTVAMLRSLGYRVEEASSGNEGLTALAALTDVVLLLTDVVMPDMTGRQLADRVTALYPDIAIVFMTGYTRNAVVHNGIVDDGVNLLGKPFSLAELGKKVAQVLQARAAQPTPAQ